MAQDSAVIRKSPFIFLKQLVAIEFFFALVPILVATVSDLRTDYEASGLAGTIPYPLLTAIVLAVLQVLILLLAFIGWYVPTYHLKPGEIVYRRSPFFEDQVLLTGTIYDITVRQGLLARRFDYGTLAIYGSGSESAHKLKDLPNPAYYRQLLLDTRGSVRAESATGPATKPLSAVIAEGEGQFVEYKSSLMWDYQRQAVNKDLYEPVMKNLAAFMNTDGGLLLIGVADDGQVLGLEPDLRSLRKPNVDGFENTFSQAFNTMIGVEFREHIDVTFPEIDGRTLCATHIRPSTEPVFLTFKGSESFYIRAGNASQPLTVSQAVRYIRKHFDQ